jgi:hypothetical protein
LPYTRPESSARAELVNQPTGPADTAFLRIAGGGGTPTALLQDPNTQPATATSLMGFTEQPKPDQPAATVPVSVDVASGHLGPADLNAQLLGGLSGGPVVDDATGNVLGLATVGADGLPTLIPAAALREAMSGAGVEPTGSPFDAVFRRGVDHLANGGMGGSATSAFTESLEYYNSALAAQYLRRAQVQGEAGDPMPGSDARPDAAGNSSVLWVVGVLTVILLLAGATVLAVRARRSGSSWAAPLHSLVSRTRRRPPGPDRSGDSPLRPPAGREAPDTVDAGPVPSGRAEAPVDPDTVERTGSSEIRAASAARSPRAAAAVATASPSASRTPAAASSSTNGAQPAYCTECGTGLHGRARFCGACGTPVQ